MDKVIVIGGGASGLLAAGIAASRGKDVVLLEKNDKLGKKLYITGKGRCNITNAVDVETMLQNIPGNPNFLYSALYHLDSFSLVDFLQRLGLKTKVERGNRVFPQSDKSSDVIQTLSRYGKDNGVKTQLNKPVESLWIENKTLQGVICRDGSKISASRVILATGGKSYPSTGSTGDGYAMATQAGHTVTPLFPSLVPLTVKESWVSQLEGLSLRNITGTLIIGAKQCYQGFGELLFTNNGMSGPLILTASRHYPHKTKQPVYFEIDLKPALTESELDTRLQRDFQKFRNKDFKNALQDLLPQKLIPVMINLSGISPGKKINTITKDERKKLVRLMKHFSLTILGTSGYNQAVVTSGGIAVKEIHPSTMESKIIPGLYFAGEIIDVDGYTGGFNLQIAFSTGYLAGTSI